MPREVSTCPKALLSIINWDRTGGKEYWEVVNIGMGKWVIGILVANVAAAEL